MPALRRKPVAPVIQEASLPAPMGGLNSVDAAIAMPATDAIRMWNMLPSELGLRVRMGDREWLTGVTGLSDNKVRTTIGYSGSTPSADRLFVTSSTGIWGATASEQLWQPDTDYVIGDRVVNDNGNVYVCDT